MKGKRIITGRVWIFGDDINTDLMYPQICYRLPEDERPKYTMSANRPGWANNVRNGDIIMAGNNFGVGSSRPAADNIKQLGVKVVIAKSFNGLFFRNAVNTGIYPIALEFDREFTREGDILKIDIGMGTIKNISKNDKLILHFNKFSNFIIDIIEKDGIINKLLKEGYLSHEPL
jgi:3-isopropylmalate/(R)-2-methylmalate dehydratase small subunit